MTRSFHSLSSSSAVQQANSTFFSTIFLPVLLYFLSYGQREAAAKKSKKEKNPANACSLYFDDD